MRTQAELPRDLAVGTGVGVFSGAFGVGGGILLVPYLVLVRGLGQKVAQATSLVMITLAAAAGATRYALDGGCDLGQGYLFSRPIPPEDLLAALERQQAR